MPGDIHTNELSAVSILLPCLTSGVIAFITGEVINDVKKRKHNGSDQKTTEKDTD